MSEASIDSEFGGRAMRGGDASPGSPWYAVLLVLLALAVSAVTHGVFLWGSLEDPAARQIEPDSHGYLTLGENLRAGKGFGREIQLSPDQPPQWMTELCRTPGYPGVLALLDAVTGNAQTAVVVLQNVLAVGLCGMIVWAAYRRFGAAAGLLAALLLVLDVQGAGLSSLVLTDSPYGVILCCATLLLVRAMERGTSKPLVAAGLIIGLSGLLRPTSMFLGIVLPLALLVAIVWRRRWSQLRGLVAFVVLVNGIMGAWVLRNGLTTGDYTLSSVGRSTVMSWHVAGVLHRAEGCSVEEANRRIAAEVGMSPTYVRAHPLTPEEKQRLGSVLRRILRENPKAFAIDWAYQTAKMVAAPDKLVLKPLGIQPGGLPSRGRSDAGQMGDTTWVGWVLWLWQIPYMLAVLGLMVWGVWRNVRCRQLPAAVWLPLLVTAYVLGMSSGSPGDGRYRWPVVPLMILIGVSGLALRRRRTAEPAPSVAAAEEREAAVAV